MMIFILATGYLFTIYLLLALVKRTENRAGYTNIPTPAKEKPREEKLAVRKLGAS